MNDRSIAIKLITILFLFFSCNSNSKKIESTFIEIKSLVKEINPNKIIELIDEDSKKYYAEITELLKDKNEYKLNNLANKYNSELMTRLLYQCLEMPDTIEISTDFSLEKMVFSTQLIGMGILNPNMIDRISFKEIKEVNGQNATVLMNYRTNPKNKVYVVTEYKFSKEEGKWKINIPSTFGFDEKLLKAKWNKYGGSARSFIDEYIESDKGEEVIKFKYQINK